MRDFDDMTEEELEKNGIQVIEEGGICDCGKETTYAEVNYGTWFCSRSCLEDFEDRVSQMLHELG